MSKLTLSIVVPVGPQEQSWPVLLQDLALQELTSTEVLLVATKAAGAEDQAVLTSLRRSIPRLVWLESRTGRAQQMNLGAKAASGTFVWFLHADSRIQGGGVRALKERLRANSERLLYFDLKFMKDGPHATLINEYGSWFRSRVLGLPFGDQGFALSRQLFFQVGSFNTGIRYGEDHLFVWQCRHHNVKLLPVGLYLGSSARKYRDQGWLKTTLLHLWLTFRQAAPELMKCLKAQIGRTLP